MNRFVTGILGVTFLVAVVVLLVIMAVSPLLLEWRRERITREKRDAGKATENGWELWVVFSLTTDWWIAVPVELHLDSDAVLAEWEDECEDDDAKTCAVFTHMIGDLDRPLAGRAEPARELLARLPRAPIGAAHIVASAKAL